MTEEKTKLTKFDIFIRVIVGIIFLIGFIMVLYPAVSDIWNRRYSSGIIREYNNVVKELETTDYSKYLEEARKYNERLAGMGSSRYTMSSSDMEEYMSILNLGGTGMIGYLRIPRINVNMPVYHTVDESVLQSAAGHIPGSSFPIGGPSTHALISGHTGMSSATLFTHLTKLEEEDTFSVSVLGETCYYEVDQIRVVLPEEMEDVEIIEGEDYCTLVTCTPYGVNSHRLLVRGTRTEAPANEKEYKNVETVINIVDTRILLAFFVPLVIVSALIVMVLIRRRRM